MIRRYIAVGLLTAGLIGVWPGWQYYVGAVDAYQRADAVKRWAEQIGPLPEKASPEQNTVPQKSDLLQKVTGSLSSFGVLVDRVRPQKDGTVHIWFKQTAHAEWVRWLAYLEDELDLQFIRLQVDSLPAPGWVSGSMVIEPT